MTRRMYPVRMETERQGVSLNLDHIPRDWRRLVVSLISGEISKHLKYLIVAGKKKRGNLVAAGLVKLWIQVVGQSQR